jgi:hypothetical protein
LNRPDNKVWTRTWAERLKVCVEDALEAAQTQPVDVRSAWGAVNWGALKCLDVEERKSLLLDSTFVAVIIEEAAPDAVGLQQYVGGWLDDNGFPDVYVSTEW